MNKAILIGRLCADPVLTYTATNNTAVCKFILAVDRKYKKEGAEKEADFIPIIAWRKTAEFIAKWFDKGDKILIENGRIECTHYQDSDDRRIYKTQVIADEVGFVEYKKKGDQKESEEPEVIPEYEEPAEDLDDDDLPF